MTRDELSTRVLVIRPHCNVLTHYGRLEAEYGLSKDDIERLIETGDPFVDKWGKECYLDIPLERPSYGKAKAS